MNTQEKHYKRKSREVPIGVRQKISQSLRGRSKSYTHRAHISQGLKDYWGHIPDQKDTDNSSHIV